MTGPGGIDAGRAAVKVLPDLSEFARSLKTYLERIERTVRVQLPTGLDTSGADADLRELQARLAEVSANVNVELDTARAREELDVLARDRHTTVHVNVDRNALGLATRRVAGFIGVFSAGGALRIAALTGGVAQLAFAATSLTAALAPAAGSLLLLPAAGLAASAAIGTLVIGLHGVGGALQAIGKGDAKKTAEALKGLAPAARSTVLELQRLGPAWKSVQKAVQQNLFGGIAGTIRSLAGTYLPILRTQLSGIATVFSDGFRATSGSLLQPATVNALRSALGNVRASLGELTSIGPDLVRAFAPIVSLGSTYLPDLADGLGDAARSFSTFIQQAAASGSLKGYLDAGLSTLSQLAHIAGDAAGAIFGIVKAAQSVGGGSLAGLETILSSLSGFINGATGQRALQTIFAGAAQGLQALSTAFGPLGQAFSAVAPVIGTIAAQLGGVLAAAVKALAPVLITLAPALQVLATSLGNGLVQVIRLLAPLLERMAQALASNQPLLIAVGVALAALAGPTGLVLAAIAALAALWSQFGGQITDVATQIGTALQPVLQGFAAAVSSLWPPLQQLGAALAGWGQTVLPIVRQVAQVFVEQWPQIRQTVASVFQSVVEIIRSAVIIVTQVIRAMTVVVSYLWNNGFGTVIIAVVKGGLTAVLGIIRGFYNVVAGIFKTIAAVLTGDWSGAWAGILQTVRGSVTIIGAVIRGAGTIIVGALKGIVQLMVGQVTRFATVAAAIGKAIIDGIVAGVSAKAHAIGDAVQSAASGALDRVKGWLKINSPSKRFRDEVGLPISEGIAFGVTKGAPQIATALTTVLKAVARTGDRSALAVGTALAANIRKVAALRDSVTAQLRQAQQRAAQLRKDAAQYAADAAASIIALGDVTKAGNGDGGTTFQAITDNLKAAITQARAFARAIAALVKLGLNPTSLSQIVQAGADSGLSAAQAILTAGKSGVDQVNALQAQLTKSATTAGRIASNAMYQVGVQAADGIVAGLKARQAELTALMQKLGRDMLAAIRHELKIKSPSRVFDEKVGTPIGQGIAQGIASQAQQIADSLSGVVNAGSGRDLVSRFVSGLRDTSAVTNAGADLAAAVLASVAPTVAATPSLASAAGTLTAAGRTGPLVAFTGPIYARDDEAVMAAASRRVTDALEFASLRGLVVT